MQDNNIKIGIEVSDGGSSAKTSRNVKNIKDVADETTVSAERATKAITAMHAAASGGGRATTAKIKQATGGDSGEERGIYAAQRATVGTGAAGRDFAKQSQGLDGLVRLYATFAANIYAVGAAFRGLSDAMDTTNMVKGLDQLGAATGQNLGGLSKQFVALTDGAVSFKEAMSATVKVTSAGFGTDTVTKLAVVAKKASQTLGIEMTDAVSRLSRGITKMEPELLDELGIFVKLEKAQDDYARSLGRTTGSLSDFEKRQAYAIAVLKEGEKKFGEIDIPANPYEKLLATLKNVTQTGLEFVNKFLAPVIKLLAESPTGVALGIAAIAAVLTKQALPAIFSFRENIRKANEEAVQKIGEIQQVIEAKKGITAQQAIQTELDSKIKSYENTIKKFRTEATKFSKQAEDIALSGGSDEAANKAYKKAQNREEGIKRYTAKIDEARKAANLQLAEEAAGLSKNIFLHENLLERQKTLMQQRSRLSTTLGNVLDDASTFGTAAGFKRLSGELKLAGKATDELGPKLGILQKASLGLQGAFGILSVGAGRLLSVLGGPLALALSFLLPLLSGLYDWLRGDAKQAEETGKSFEVLQGSLENTTKTIERINKLAFGEQLTVETIVARSNALNDLSDNLSKVLENISKQKAAQGWWAGIFDSITGGIQKEGAEKIGKSIVLALQAAQEGPAKDAAKETLAALLGIKVFDEPTITKALASTKDFTAVADKAGKAITELAKQENQRSVGLQSAKESQDKVTKSYDEFIQSVLKTDALTTLAKNIISFGLDLDRAFQDPISSIAELNRIAGDTKALAMFSPEAQNDILKYNKQLQDIQKQIDEATAAERSFNQELEKQKKARDSTVEGSIRGHREMQTRAAMSPEKRAEFDRLRAQPDFGLTKEMKDLLNNSNKQAEIIKNLRSDLAKTATEVNKVIQAPASVFSAGIDLFINELNKSYGKAGLLLAEAVASAYGDLPGAATMSAELKNKELQNQINLIDATIRLTLATQTAALMQQEGNALEKVKLYGSDPMASAMYEAAKKELDAIEGIRQEFTKGIKGTDKEIKDLSNRMISATPEQRAALKPVLEASLTTAAARSQQATLKAQQGVNLFQAGQVERVNLAKEQEKANNLQKQENSFVIQKLGLQKDSLGLLSEENILKTASLTKDNLILTYLSKNQTLLAEENNIRELIAKTEEGPAKQAAKERLKRLERERQLVGEIYEFDKNQADLKARQEILQRNEKIRLDEVATQNTLLGFVRQEAEARLALQEQELSLLNAKGIASETYTAKVNAEITARRQELQVAQELKAVDDARTAAIEALKVQRAAIPLETVYTEDGPVQQQNSALLAESLAREKTLGDTYDRQKASILQINALKIQGNELAKQAQLETAANNKRLEEQAIAMERIQGIAKDLGTVFGEFGKSLGTGLESILKTIQDFDNKRRDTDKKYSKDKLDLEQTTTENIKNIYAEGLDPSLTEDAVVKAKADAKIEKEKLDTDYARKSKNLEIDKNIAIVASAKSMFKEKTAAYKILGGIEKAMTVAKLAMNAQQMISDGILTAKSIANTMERAFADGQGAVVKAYNSIPFPLNIAAAATVAALVAAVIGKSIGGTGGSIPAGSTAEERQAVQGTGQKYDSEGNLITTKYGVLGDPTKQLETISNGINYLEKYAIGNLEYSNDMLDALRGIRENTSSFVTALIKTNITKRELSSSGGNWLTGKTSTENIDKLLSVSGTLQEVINKTADVNQVIVNKITEGSGFLGGLFGGGDDVSLSRNLEKFNPREQRQIEASLSLLFSNMAQAVEAGATTLNLNLDPLWKSLFRLPDNFETSLLEMSFEDMGKALEANVGLTLSEFVSNTFPQLEKFQKAGEDLGTMFLRLASDSQTLKAAFDTIGITLPTLTESIQDISTDAMRAAVNTTQRAVDVAQAEVDRIRGLVGTTVTGGSDEGYYSNYIGAEALIGPEEDLRKARLANTTAINELATAEVAATTRNIEAEQRIIALNGGMDSFLNRIKAYNSSILTAGDRTEAAVSSYDKLITSIDSKLDVDLRTILSTVRTKDQFQALYESIDQTTPAGAALGAALLKLVPSFTAITEATEKYNTALEDQKVKMGALGIAGGLTPDQAKQLERNRQIVKINEEYTTTQAAILVANQRLIWQAEDTIEARKGEISIMQAQGYTYAALLETRRLELMSLTTEQRTLKERLYAIEDQNKTTALNIELLEASGDAEGALYQRRVQELKGLSLTDQAIKRRIWLLQDEKKVLTAKNAQEIKIYELLGNASEVLRLQREAELESMDAALRPGQRYIYALQDQKTIYDKLKTTITNTTSSLKTSIQTLRDYQTSLKTGDKTILKPEEVYALRRQEFFDLKTIAEAVATTPSEEAAQAAAISKLPTAADAFLESSRTLFASGQAYTDDFNLIDSILTSLSTTLTGQLSDAERNLNELKTANGFLETIDDSTKRTSELMSELVTATANVAIARAGASAAGYTSAGGSAGNFSTGVNIPGGQVAPTLGAQTTTGPYSGAMKVVYDWYMNHPDAQKNPDVADISWWASYLGTYQYDDLKLSFSRAVAQNRGLNYVVPINAFAAGGVASGLSLVGEQGPELVDFNTPARVYPAGQTSAMLANNTALVEEIKALRQEVEKLRSEQKEQTGHLITTNYDANRMAAEAVAKATENASKEMAWTNRSAARVV